MAWNDTDAAWMKRAIALAHEGGAKPGMNPIGCVIVRDDQVIGEACNEVDLRHDPTAHAEILAMRRAGKRLQCNQLKGTVLYTTLQPCGMCTMALIWAKIGRVVYGAGRDDVHKMYFEDRHLDTMDFIRDAYRDDILVDGGLMATECAALYVPPDADVPKSQQFNQ
jgi:tRNA(adenine34) deaminase